MEIRGVPYNRQTMGSTYANEHLRDQEPITLHAQTHGGIPICCTIL